LKTVFFLFFQETVQDCFYKKRVDPKKIDLL